MAVDGEVSLVKTKRVSSRVSRLVAAFISPLVAFLIMFRHSLWRSALLSMAWISVVESKK